MSDETNDQAPQPDPTAAVAETPRRRGRKSSRIAKVTSAAPVAPIEKSESLKRAEARTQELLGNIEEADGVDKFYIDPAIIPDGWTYEWKRYLVLGKTDPSYAVELRRGGWEAVPAERHPDMMPFGSTDSAAIERDGMLLMERPLKINEQRRARERRMASDQMRQKQQQLSMSPQGQFERDNKGHSLINVKSHGFEPIPVPKHE